MSAWRDPEPGDRYRDNYGDVFTVDWVAKTLHGPIAHGKWEYRKLTFDHLRSATLNSDAFTLLPERRSPWRKLLDTLGLRSKGTQEARHPDRSNPK